MFLQINVSGAVVEFVECIIESEATQESHAVLVTNGGEVDVTESRIYGACPPGTAIKVAGELGQAAGVTRAHQDRTLVHQVLCAAHIMLGRGG